jgi:predicted transcriptional regulator
MVTVSISVDQSLVDALDDEKRRQDRSRSWIVRQAIAQYLEKQQSRRAPEGPRHA